MKRKLMLHSVALILISVVITSILAIQINTQSQLTQRESELLNYCILVNQALKDAQKREDRIDYPKIAWEYATKINLRVTIIAADGKVLADSTSGWNYVNLENHGHRAEVVEALQSGSGVSIRRSSTLGEEYVYAAAVLRNEGAEPLVTRIAMRFDRWDLIKRFIITATVFSAFIGGLVALLLGYLLAGRIVKPIEQIATMSDQIADGNYQERIHIRTGDELEQLGRTINEMAEKLDLSAAETMRLESIRKDFVANVSHELKTPLTSISGFVEALQDGAGENPGLRGKFLSIIAAESTRLRRLIDDLLIISDIENGRERNTDQDIDIREAIEEVIAFLQPIIDQKGIRIIDQYAYQIQIGGNRDRFKQMMLNIIDNAIKYSHEGGDVRLDVKKQDGKAVISVSDNGIGIEPENLPRLFERFYRVDKSRSIKSGGTGLGLSIVKHIVNLFHGEIKVESKPGEGTTFTVTLPSN